MSLNLERLSFDPANVADGPSIGSYLIGAGAGVITETTVGSDICLDISVKSSSGQYAEDSAHTTADIGNFVLAVRNDAGTALAADGDYSPFSLDSAGALRVSGSITASPTYDYAEDAAHVTADVGAYILSVRADARPSGANVGSDGDYASIFVNASGELWVKDADMLAELQSITHAEDAAHSSGNVGVFSLSVRDDVYAANGGAGTDADYQAFLTDAAGRLWINESCNASFASAAATVGTSEAALPASALALRKKVLIQNRGTKSIYVGPTGVTTSTGIEVGKGSTLELNVGPNIALFGISGTAGQNVRVFETA